MRGCVQSWHNMNRKKPVINNSCYQRHLFVSR